MTDGLDLLATQRAVFLSALGSAEKLVALALLDFWSAASPKPFPSVATLASRTSFDRTTVMRSLRDLEKKGVLVVNRRAGAHSSYDLGRLVTLPVAPCDTSQGTTGRAVPPVAESDTTGRVAPPVPVAPCDTKDPREGSQKRNPGGGSPKLTKVETPLPADWQPTEAHRLFASKHGLELDLEATAFHGRFDGQMALSWNGRFTTWLAKEAKWKLEREQGAGRRESNEDAKLKRKVTIEHARGGTYGPELKRRAIDGDNDFVVAEVERRQQLRQPAARGAR